MNYRAHLGRADQPATKRVKELVVTDWMASVQTMFVPATRLRRDFARGLGIEIVQMIPASRPRRRIRELSEIGHRESGGWNGKDRMGC